MADYTIYRLGNATFAHKVTSKVEQVRGRTGIWIHIHLTSKPQLVSTKTHSLLDGDTEAGRVEGLVQDHAARMINCPLIHQALTEHLLFVRS